MNVSQLNEEIGNIDLHLLDQILKGTFKQGMRICDAGCGEGRNLIYFLKNGYDVYAVDKNPNAVKMARMQARSLNSHIGPDHFILGDLANLPFSDQYFDVLFSVNVLHLVDDEDQFNQIMDEFFRVLKSKALLMLKMQCFIHGRTPPENSCNDTFKDVENRFLNSNELMEKILNKHSCNVVDSRYEIINEDEWAFVIFRKN